MSVHVGMVINVNEGVPLPLKKLRLFFLFLFVASCLLSSSRALSGCIQLSNHKELRDLKLDTVRILLLEDGANPCE